MFQGYKPYLLDTNLLPENKVPNPEILQFSVIVISYFFPLCVCTLSWYRCVGYLVIDMPTVYE